MSTIPIQTKIVILICLVGGSYLIGRYSAPEKVVTETKVVEVEKKHEDINTKVNTKTKIIQTKKPDGSEETVTVVTSATNTTDTKTTQLDETKDDKKEVTKSGRHINLALLGGVNVSGPFVPVYGVHVSANVIGPLTVGAFGMTDGMIGASIGVSF